MLSDQIKEELKAAMKSVDTKTTSVLRMVISAMHSKEIELRTLSGKAVEELTDEQVLDVIRKEVKKRKESISAFTVGGRPALAAKEQEELVILRRYLPPEMSEEEIRVVIERSITTHPSNKEFGALMKIVMQELKGKADAGLIAKLLKEKL
mgnify:CR=1 FL=1